MSYKLCCLPLKLPKINQQTNMFRNSEWYCIIKIIIINKIKLQVSHELIFVANIIDYILRMIEN